MSYESQLQAAHKQLEDKGVWTSNFNPPIAKLLRFCGLKFPPPYYQNFMINFSFSSIVFGLLFSVLNWFINTQSLNKPITQLILKGVCGGLLFGLIMSVFYLVRRKQLGLSSWEDLA
ncbi:DUF6404 family protein [Vibrio lamellibrachiae]|uniref:DUF6404 family protein n=1 Tax=Vibrio lamellibrachiae TaxID=2910253 RepID=UPI003D0BB2B9